jgi:hypothetical protein
MPSRSDGERLGGCVSAEGRVGAVPSSAATVLPPRFNEAVARVADRFADRLRAFARPWELACFIWVPAIALTYAFWYELTARSALEDFSIFRVASKAVLHGRSPFVAPDPRALAHFDKFVYPPSTALLLSPIAALPVAVGQVLMLVLGVVCVVVALRLFDVSDWRCYGVAAMSAPVVNSLALGALTSFLLVGVAATWRYRDRPAVAGVAASLTAVVKLFLWPLGVWLLVTRRLRATVTCALLTVLVLVAGWAVIGFAGLRSYPHLLHVLSEVEAGVSYSPAALLRVSGTSATVLSVALTLAVVLAVVLASRGSDGDRRAFAVAVIGSLVATPMLWLHYFALLLVPIALYRPRLSALWFAPVVLWLTPTTHSHGSLWRIVFALAVVGVVAARTVVELPRPGLLTRAMRVRTVAAPAARAE